jgi:hypothetical protein
MNGIISCVDRDVRTPVSGGIGLAGFKSDILRPLSDWGIAMGELWIGLIGVIIGAALSLTGSIMVNRWQLAKQTRLNIWETILPELTLQSSMYKMRRENNPGRVLPLPPIKDQLVALHLKAVTAGRKDWRASGKLGLAWAKMTLLHFEAKDPAIRKEGPREPEEIDKELLQAEEEFRRVLSDYYSYVEKRLRWS